MGLNALTIFPVQGDLCHRWFWAENSENAVYRRHLHDFCTYATGDLPFADHVRPWRRNDGENRPDRESCGKSSAYQSVATPSSESRI